ncbi:putative DNA helicase [Aeromonas phage pAEv1810]|uniref:putative DNA helicase n=1 Tax=Aeromonas phage pAEv1810 TaxID=2908744 RepID=UPI0023291BE2|nr:putative DNA helicase [Aeromonas phage pAEv1810]UIS25174.1 putative DNA helicase [Aeromonas phage pAEv1810]
MLSGYFTLSPKVEQVGSFYVVTGINTKAFESDLRTNFGTSVIFNRLITRINARSFKIHKFFMVELAWILDHLTNQKNKRTVDRYYVGLFRYKQLYDEVKTKTWLETTYQTFPSYPVDEALKEFTITPYPDQRDFLEEYSRIKYGFQLKGCLLDAVVGSGKSPTSLIWSKMISKGKLFIVVPKGLVYSPWVNEINKVYKKPPKVWTSLDGTNILNHVDAEIFIIHKELIRTESWELAIKTITKNGQLPAKVIVDECHNYNEHSSQQTKGLIDFCSHPYISDVLFMSGTPIKAQGKETYALFTIIDKFFDKNVRDNFLKMYGRDNTFLNEMLAHRLGRIKYTIPAITTMEAPPEPEVIKVSFPGAEAFTLNNIRTDMLTYITERVRFYKERMSTYKEDWLIYVNDFKERKWSDQSIQARVKTYVDYVNYFQTNGYNNFTDADKSKFCASVEKEIESYLKGEDLHYFRHIKSAVKYVGLKIRGEALGNVLGKARMNAIKETIRHANLPKLIEGVKKKTLVYTSYVEVIKELEDYFKEVGLKSVSVYGNNSTEIDKVIGQLTDDPDTNPLITTFQTLREGKPMLMANQIILMNSPFRSYELTQTIARVHRRGQDEKCYVYLIDLDTGEEENITSRSIDIMEWSREQVEALLGGGKIPGVAELGVNTTAIGGMESGEYIWDIPTMDPLLDIPLDVVEAVPSISLIRTSISDVF